MRKSTPGTRYKVPFFCDCSSYSLPWVEGL
jgi:hypothetical protein